MQLRQLLVFKLTLACIKVLQSRPFSGRAIYVL